MLKSVPYELNLTIDFLQPDVIPYISVIIVNICNTAYQVAITNMNHEDLSPYKKLFILLFQSIITNPDKHLTLTHVTNTSATHTLPYVLHGVTNYKQNSNNSIIWIKLWSS